MESGYFAIAILCLFYYGVLVWHTKRWKSTFSWFWIVFAMLNVVVGFIVKLSPDFVDYIVWGISAVLWVFFIAVEIIILCAMAVIPKDKLDYIIVLGAQVRGRQITGSLRRRLDKALRYLRENPKTICIVSGGKGKDEEISEAEAMSEYLVTGGIEKERILLEDKSTTTWENFKFSSRFIKNIEKEKIGIISNNFHIYRAMKMARIQGYKKVFALPATTDMVMFPNYMVREFFALFMMLHEMKDMNNS